jgi:hypothetical protein
MRPDRDDDGVGAMHDAGSFERDAGIVARDDARARRRVHGVPARGQPARGAHRNRLAEAFARHDDVGGARAGRKRLAKHVKEGLARGALGRRIERRHAKRLPQRLAHARRQRTQHLGHAGAVVAGVAAPMQAGEPAQRRAALADGKPACRGETRDQSERAGQGRNGERQRFGGRRSERRNCQRAPLPRRCVVRSNESLGERDRLRVRAEQQVLAVVQRKSVAWNGSGATPERGGSLVQLDAVSKPRELHGGRAAGPPAADDDDGSARRARWVGSFEADSCAISLPLQGRGRALGAALRAWVTSPEADRCAVSLPLQGRGRALGAALRAHARHAARVAIHSLRSGVSATRRSSTR